MSNQSEISANENRQFVNGKRNARIKGEDMRDNTLDNRLPFWINRFVLLIFLVAISLPVALLTLIRQPVYKSQSITGKMQEKRLIIHSGLSSEITDTANVGKTVRIILQLSGQGDSRKRNFSATIQSVEVDKAGKSCTMVLTAGDIDKIAGNKSQINPALARDNFEGMILFKTGTIALLHKIF
jgi:hypothetical protein